jgi:hypothetical protein
MSPYRISQKPASLPTKPLQAASLINTNSESMPITSTQFGEINRDLLDALHKYVSSAEKRYDSALRDGGIMVFRAPEYDLAYDNGGYEHFEGSVDDATSDPVKMQPLVKWAHQVISFSNDVFRKSGQEEKSNVTLCTLALDHE